MTVLSAIVRRSAVAARAATVAALLSACSPASSDTVVVGSKPFTENVILAEVAAQLMLAEGQSVSHRRELGGTRILWTALLEGSIDAYPEYTGTLVEEILGGDPQLRSAPDQVADVLAQHQLAATKPLGFDNSYAIGMRRSHAERLGVTRISDLAQHLELRWGLSNELMERKDGWPGLRSRYQLRHTSVRGIEHGLSYQALDTGAVDLIDLYTTDAEIARYQIRILIDDKRYFPRYEPIYLYRKDLEDRAPSAIRALERLEGALDTEDMVRLNSHVVGGGLAEEQVASIFLKEHLKVDAPRSSVQESQHTRLLKHGLEHLFLVLVGVVASMLIGVPLGLGAALGAQQQGARAKARSILLAPDKLVLGAVGATQTVPSMALLVLSIPLFGIGQWPAIVAIVLYGLLPIVRGTYLGLSTIPLSLRESAESLGLSPAARLWHIDLPLASPAIWSGIKTSAVLSVGTATIGALVGAGGYGELILTGVRLNSTPLILEGALPAAALALGVQGLFDLAERWIIPRGLRS